MTHLTLSGASAGRPLCDCDRRQAERRDEQFVHALFAMHRGLDTVAPDCCPKCRTVYDEVMAEDN